jgi:hypothetical protein
MGPEWKGILASTAMTSSVNQTERVREAYFGSRTAFEFREEFWRELLSGWKIADREPAPPVKKTRDTAQPE